MYSITTFLKSQVPILGKLAFNLLSTQIVHFNFSLLTIYGTIEKIVLKKDSILSEIAVLGTKFRFYF